MLTVLFNHINNIREMVTNFKKNNKSKRKYKKYKTITTILKSFDTFVAFATTSSSFTLSLTVIGVSYRNINCNSMRTIDW